MGRRRISGLYAIVDNSLRPELPHFDLALCFLSGSARILQLRQKGACADEVLENARRIMTLKRRFDFLFFVNDNPEAARIVGADGVHLGQGDMPAGRARKIIGAGKIIGRSTHSEKEALSAVNEGADYIACGAVFPTSTKPAGHPVIGLDGLGAIVKKAHLPVVAIGGINRGNAQKVINAGASCIALISALVLADDISKETKYFVNLF